MEEEGKRRRGDLCALTDLTYCTRTLLCVSSCNDLAITSDSLIVSGTLKSPNLRNFVEVIPELSPGEALCLGIPS